MEIPSNNVVTTYMKQHRITISELARMFKVSPQTMRERLSKSWLHSHFLFEASAQLNHDFFADLSKILHRKHPNVTVLEEPPVHYIVKAIAKEVRKELEKDE